MERRENRAHADHRPAPLIVPRYAIPRSELGFAPWPRPPFTSPPFATGTRNSFWGRALFVENIGLADIWFPGSFGPIAGVKPAPFGPPERDSGRFSKTGSSEPENTILAPWPEPDRSNKRLRRPGRVGRDGRLSESKNSAFSDYEALGRPRRYVFFAANPGLGFRKWRAPFHRPRDRGRPPRANRPKGRPPPPVAAQAQRRPFNSGDARSKTRPAKDQGRRITPQVAGFPDGPIPTNCKHGGCNWPKRQGTLDAGVVGMHEHDNNPRAAARPHFGRNSGFRKAGSSSGRSPRPVVGKRHTG